MGYIISGLELCGVREYPRSGMKLGNQCGGAAGKLSVRPIDMFMSHESSCEV